MQALVEELGKRFGISEYTVRNWVETFESANLLPHQREEVLHYLTKEQLEQGIVSMQAEHEYLVSQYSLPTAPSQLRTPVETFGEKTATPPCVKCKSRDTTFFAIQNRSADEPTSYFFQCNTCRHSWKYR